MPTYVTLANGNKRVLLTKADTSPLVLPNDWNLAANTVEVVGPGGVAGAMSGGNSSRGGGGGAYSAISNYAGTSGSSVAFQAIAAATCWFGSTSTVLAQPGGAGATGGGLGGQASTGVGTIKFGGGSGGSTVGSGGGGGAGPNGNGSNAGAGGAGDGSTVPAGTSGTEWGTGFGVGGGGTGGGANNPGVAGPSYGGGAGGGQQTTAVSGGGPLIVLTYTPVMPRRVSCSTC